MDASEQDQENQEAFFDREVERLSLRMAVAVQNCGLNPQMLLEILDWIGIWGEGEGSRIGVLRYWSRVLRRETPRIG